MRNGRGFFIAEGMMGTALLAVAAVALLVGITRQSVASRTLADRRAATRAAEATLARLQARLDLVSGDAKEQVVQLPEPASVKGFNWVEVRATVGNQSRSVTGLVPEAMPQTVPAEGSRP
jgi:hypothetical protein